MHIMLWKDRWEIGGTFELRYGILLLSPALFVRLNLCTSMHCSRKYRLLLFALLFCMWSPTLPALLALSLPARSTKVSLPCRDLRSPATPKQPDLTR